MASGDEGRKEARRSEKEEERPKGTMAVGKEHGWKGTKGKGRKGRNDKGGKKEGRLKERIGDREEQEG